MTIYTAKEIATEVEAARKHVRTWYGWKVARVESWDLRIDGHNTCLAVHVCGIKDENPVSHVTTIAI